MGGGGRGRGEHPGVSVSPCLPSPALVLNSPQVSPPPLSDEEPDQPRFLKL